MPSPNVIGYVTEFVEDRVPAENSNEQIVKIRLKLKLKNTFNGKERIVWVDGPSDLGEFFNPGSGEVTCQPE